MPVADPFDCVRRAAALPQLPVSTMVAKGVVRGVGSGVRAPPSRAHAESHGTQPRSAGLLIRSPALRRPRCRRRANVMPFATEETVEVRPGRSSATNLYCFTTKTVAPVNPNVSPSVLAAASGLSTAAI